MVSRKEMQKAVDHGEEDLIFLLFHIVPGGKTTWASPGHLGHGRISRNIVLLSEGTFPGNSLTVQFTEESATLNIGIIACRQEKKIQKNHFHTLKEARPSLSPQCVRTALNQTQPLYPALSSLKSSAFSSLLLGSTSLLDRMEFASQEVKKNVLE